MKKNLLLIVVIGFSNICQAQDIQTGIAKERKGSSESKEKLGSEWNLDLGYSFDENQIVTAISGIDVNINDNNWFVKGELGLLFSHSDIYKYAAIAMDKRFVDKKKFSLDGFMGPDIFWDKFSEKPEVSLLMGVKTVYKINNKIGVQFNVRAPVLLAAFLPLFISAGIQIK